MDETALKAVRLELTDHLASLHRAFGWHYSHTKIWWLMECSMLRLNLTDIVQGQLFIITQVYTLTWWLHGMAVGSLRNRRIENVLGNWCPCGSQIPPEGLSIENPRKLSSPRGVQEWLTSFSFLYRFPSWLSGSSWHLTTPGSKNLGRTHQKALLSLEWG